MSGDIWVAIIGAAGLVLAATITVLGGMAKSVISEIIGRYKQQSDSTVDAKDAEIGRLRDGVTARLDRIEAAIVAMQRDRLP